MAEWVHCNACYSMPSSKVHFFLTNCGHLYCSICVNMEKSYCKQCQTRCTLIPLTSKMKPELQVYFMDPTNLVKKQNKELLQVLDFQKNHQRKLNAYMMEKLNQQGIHLSKLETAFKGIQGNNRELQQCKAENAYLKKLLEKASSSPKSSPQMAMFGEPVYRASPNSRIASPSARTESPLVNGSSGFRVKPPYDLPNVIASRVRLANSPSYLNASQHHASPAPVNLPITPRHLAVPSPQGSRSDYSGLARRIPTFNRPQSSRFM